MEMNPITEVKKHAGQKPSTTSNSGLENIDYDSSDGDEGKKDSCLMSYLGVSIPTGEEARLAKMKPTIYGHSRLHEGTKWWRYIA